MKIALITPYDYPYPGGVTEHIRALDREFRAAGHDTRIIAASSLSQQELGPNVVKVTGDIAPVPFSGSMARITLSPAAFPRMQEALSAENFDVIHVHEPTVPLLSWIALSHASPRAVKVGTFHAYRETNRLYKYGHAWANFIVEHLDGRIFVSEAVRDYIGLYFPGDYSIIPNGIDYARFASPYVEPIAQFADGRPNILFVGRLEPRKGFQHLLGAMPLVRQAVPDARLLVVGAFSGQEQAPFVEYARRHGIDDVHFVGHVAPQELPRYYRTATIFCAPSTGYESFGIVLLEAMAAGVPIVASDIAGYRQVLHDRVEGRLVAPADEPAIADALIGVLQDPSLRRRMAARGLKTAVQYDWHSVAARVLDYYNGLRDQRPQPAKAARTYPAAAQCSPA